MIFPNPTVKNKNICYNMDVHICSSEENTSKLLEDGKIERVEIFNKFNQFYTTGSLIYSDDSQIIDKYIGKPIVLVQLFFSQRINVPETNSQIVNSKVRFSHSFLVDKISILKRQEQTITYKLDLVDVNKWKMLKEVKFTSYGNEKTKIGKILQSVFDQAGLKTNQKTIDTIGKSVDYITNTEDNTMDVFKYLMGKMVYDKNASPDEETLRLLGYNLMEDEYFIYSMDKQDISQYDIENKYPQANMLFLSMYDRDQLEKIIQKKEVGLGILSLMSKTQLLNSLRKKRIHTYDIESNSFGLDLIESMVIANVYNSTKVQKQKDKISMDDMNILEDKKIFDGEMIHEDVSRWENDLNVYQDLTDMLLNNDSLIVNVNGNINRIPGADFQIWITNPTKTEGNTSAQDAQDFMIKYRQILGFWIVSSVRHIIEPSKGQFNDVIGLFRNW